LNLQTYERAQLDAGLTVLCAAMPHVRSVSMGLYIPIGSRYEEAAQAGISHFLEHMLFKGCQGWPTALTIANEIEGRGGYLNASTSQEFISLWVKVGTRHWRQALSLLAGMAQQPLLDPAECLRERGVILEEIAMNRDEPEDFVSQLSSQALWGDHPLGREIAGEAETVMGLDAESLRAFHQHTFHCGGMVLTLAGAIGMAEVVSAAAAEFGPAVAASARPTFLPAPHLPDHPRWRVHNRATDQAHVQLAVPGLPRNSPDRFALRLLDVLVGDGMSSRLWQRVREDLGLAYSIGSYRAAYADSGVFGVYGGCDARRLYQMLDAIQAVWRQVQEAPISADELQHCKEYIKGRMELASEDSSSVAAWWGWQAATGTEPWTLDQTLAAIDAVTAADVQRLAQQIWRPQALTLAYVGPRPNEKKLTKWLAAV